MLSIQKDTCVQNTYLTLQQLLADTSAELTKLAKTHLESGTAYVEAIASIAHSSCLRRGHLLQAAIASALGASGKFAVRSPLRLYGDVKVERALGVQDRPRYIEIDIVAVQSDGTLYAIEVVTSLNAISSHRWRTIQRRFELARELLPGWVKDEGLVVNCTKLSLVTLDDPVPDIVCGGTNTIGLNELENMTGVRVHGCIRAAMRGFDAALTPLFVQLEALR
jgi:hypothetical protein